MKSLTDGLKSLLGLVRGGAEEHVPFKVMFGRFRQVLDSHNAAMEIIADMGDKLGGDYIFDINYIKPAYEQLYSDLSVTLSGFNSLTGNRYAGLKEVFDSVDGEVRRLVYDIGPQSRDMVLFYEDITWNRAREVGGKMASLAGLKNDLKVEVPYAFTITTHAFDEFMRHNGTDRMIAAIGPEAWDTGQPTAGVQAAIMNGSFPAPLDNAIAEAVLKMRALCKKDCAVAVRSSAEEEDGRFSFAGQFETVLNVPLGKEAIEEAYKKVVASLFSRKAVAYQRGLGYDMADAKMAVGCVMMVDAVSSGVIYSINPEGNEREMLVSSTWGLGKSVVEGQTDADLYIVNKGDPPALISLKTGKKRDMVVRLKGSGTDTVATPDELASKGSLSEEQLIRLSKLAIYLEKRFRKPLDIEWAIDPEGREMILQARPLVISSGEGRPSSPGEPVSDWAILMKAEGILVHRGAGAGKAFVLDGSDDLDGFPKGAVLVAKHDSSDFIRVMPLASSIITDVGTPTSHMASLCREFRIPAFVNAGNVTQVIKHGQEITVSAGDTLTVYEGTVGEVLEQEGGGLDMDKLYEFRKKRYILKYISALNLIDPLLDEFTPAKCRTMHDILRFIHEKSVMELIETARHGPGGQDTLKLDVPIPVGITVVDIGGGTTPAAETGRGRKVTLEQIASAPFRAVLQGMMHPGAWHSEAVSLNAGDFLASMMRMPDIVSDNESYLGYNVAVISGDYVNLSLRFGYHFNMLDCLCSENTRNNHIYFRFVGGATDISKRSRRVQLIALILKEYGFNIKIKGDLLIARLANIKREEMEAILDIAGRLIAYTRQLDAALHDDSKIELYAKQFMEGNYQL